MILSHKHRTSTAVEELLVAASCLSFRFAHEASVFSENRLLPSFFLSLKIIPMEGSSDSQSYKKNHRPDFALQQFLF